MPEFYYQCTCETDRPCVRYTPSPHSRSNAYVTVSRVVTDVPWYYIHVSTDVLMLSTDGLKTVCHNPIVSPSKYRHLSTRLECYIACTYCPILSDVIPEMRHLWEFV